MGVTSLNQLVIWWDTQHGIDMSSDPHQIALMNLEKYDDFCSVQLEVVGHLSGHSTALYCDNAALSTGF